MQHASTDVEELRLETEVVIQLETDDPSGCPESYEANLLQMARSSVRRQASCQLG